MTVKIDIPGIGTVDAENAASESTLSSILDALSNTNSKRSKEVKEQSEEEREAFRKRQEDEQAREERKKQIERDQERYWKELKGVGIASVVEGFSLSLKSTTSLLSSYNETAKDPIGAGKKAIDNAIEIVANAAKITSDLVSGAIGAFGAGIPIVGAGLKATADVAGKLSTKLIEFGESSLKGLNAALAEEFSARVKAVDSLMSSGASFAGGLTQFGNLANQSGLSIEQFANVIKTSRQDITNMGISASDASALLSGGLNKLATTTGTSGMTLRQEMRAIGIEYQDQGQYMAQYAAQMKASGKEFPRTAAGLTELAEGTVSYARDLKVLADITGQNAQQAVEDARKKSLESDILAQLHTPEEREKFKKALELLPEDQKKGFMEYVSSGGRIISDVATNIAMQQNDKIKPMFQEIYAGMKDSGKDVGKFGSEVWDATARVSEHGRQLAEAGQNTLAFAGRMSNVSGEIGQAIKILNESNASMRKVGQYDAAMTAANTMKDAQDKASNTFLDMADTTQKFQTNMSQIAGSTLPAYSDVMKKAIDLQTGQTLLTAKLMSGQISTGDYWKETKKLAGNLIGSDEKEKETPARTKTGKYTSTTPSGETVYDVKGWVSDFFNKEKDTTAQPHNSKGTAITKPPALPIEPPKPVQTPEEIAKAKEEAKQDKPRMPEPETVAKVVNDEKKAISKDIETVLSTSMQDIKNLLKEIVDHTSGTAKNTKDTVNAVR